MKMNFNKKVLLQLNNRQLNISDKLRPAFYEKKIVKSCFDSTNDFFSLEKKFDETSSFNFSSCGNFLAEENNIWKINEDFTFNESYVHIKTSVYSNTVKVRAFNNDSTLFFFSEFSPNEDEFLVFDLFVGKTISLIPHKSVVIDISCSPSNSNLFIYGDKNNTIHRRDLRCSKTEVIKKNVTRFNSAQYNPMNDNLILVTSKCTYGVYVFDLRNHQSIMNYHILYNDQLNITNGFYNEKGDQILLNRVYSNPLLFCSNNPYPVFEFDDFGFFNFYSTDFVVKYSKNCCFVGPNDEYVAAASRNDKVYIWKIPKKKLRNQTSQSLTKIDSAKFILSHLSEVNSLQYNYQHSVLGCSGPQETLKFWSPFEFYLNLKKKDSSLYRENTEDNFSSSYPWRHTDTVLIDFMNECLLIQYRKYVLLKDYFVFDFQSFIDPKTEDLLNDLKKDLNIFHIKEFIKEYEFKLKYKNLVLLKKVNENIEEDVDFEIRYSQKEYMSIMHELYKVYLTRIFIEKSINYLDKQKFKFKKLKQKIILEKDVIIEPKKKLFVLKKIKHIFSIMIADLKLILLKDKIYVDAIKLIGSFFYLFQKTAYIGHWHGIVDLKESELFCYDRMGALISYSPCYEKIRKISKTKIPKFKKFQEFKIFEEELNESISELKLRLEFKKLEISK